MPYETPTTRALYRASTGGPELELSTLAERLSTASGGPQRALDRLDEISRAVRKVGQHILPGLPGCYVLTEDGAPWRLVLPASAGEASRREAVELAATVGLEPERGASWAILTPGQATLRLQRA